MNPAEAAAAGAGQGLSDVPPRPGKAWRVLIFFLYFFVFVIGIPMLAIAFVQAKYGLIDGPPSFPADPFGEQVKTVAKYGIFVWAGMQFFIFGRVATWVSAVPAVAGIEPVAAETLMQRLLSLNEQDIPYTISRGTRANEIVVRAQDRYASFDWSAGRGPDLLSLNWKMSLGITFYEYQHERVFGLQFKDGKPTFDLSYAYTFNLNELKQPMIEIIRHAGWNFRPVITFFRPVGG